MIQVETQRELTARVGRMIGDGDAPLARVYFALRRAEEIKAWVQVDQRDNAEGWCVCALLGGAYADPAGWWVVSLWTAAPHRGAGVAVTLLGEALAYFEEQGTLPLAYRRADPDGERTIQGAYNYGPIEGDFRCLGDSRSNGFELHGPRAGGYRPEWRSPDLPAEGEEKHG